MERQAVRLLACDSRHYNTGALRKFYQFYSIGSDIEAKRAEIAKRNTSGRTIGGRSVWGNLIAPVIEKFHWSYEYTVWGISYLNLQMLLADTQDYFPDYSHTSGTGRGGTRTESRRSNEVINGDDPKNRAKMKEIFGWD